MIKFTKILLMIILFYTSKSLIVGGFTKTAPLPKCKQLLNVVLDRYHHTEFQNARVTSCRTQVVAGTNYWLVLEHQGQTCNVVIYEDLQGNLSLNTGTIRENPCFTN